MLLVNDRTMNIFKKIKSIFIGWYNVLTNKLSNEAKERYEICKQCDSLVKMGKTQWCGECGCAIPQKCASPEEKCLIGKW